jgi:response regulator of citrate/malate metabolism
MDKILIVEDDLQFKALIEMRLKSIIPGSEIIHAPSINSARSILSNNLDLDLVVLDQHLPDGLGVELLEDGSLANFVVLSVSSDDNPEIPGKNVSLGAAYFLSKTQVSQPLFKPLLQAVISRAKLEKQLAQSKVNQAVLDSIKTLVSTLRHEINNPLGAVLGGAYLLKNIATQSPDQKEAAELVEQSGKRIKHVLEQLITATNIEATQKADTTVFHIPGDPEWKK